jgi:hypothetical protein
LAITNDHGCKVKAKGKEKAQRKELHVRSVDNW